MVPTVQRKEKERRPWEARDKISGDFQVAQTQLLNHLKLTRVTLDTLAVDPLGNAAKIAEATKVLLENDKDSHEHQLH